MKLRVCAVALSMALTPWTALAQDPPPDPQSAGAGRGGQAAREPQIRPFDRVITRDAKSDEGIFTVHRIGDRVFYEIPPTSSDASSSGSVRSRRRRLVPDTAARRQAIGW